MPDANALVEALRSAAIYNDKGFQWSNHSPAKVEAMQAGFHAELVALAMKVGHERLGPELSSAILGGAASRDASGDWANLAEKLLRRAHTHAGLS